MIDPSLHNLAYIHLHNNFSPFGLIIRQDEPNILCDILSESLLFFPRPGIVWQRLSALGPKRAPCNDLHLSGPMASLSLTALRGMGLLFSELRHFERPSKRTFLSCTFFIKATVFCIIFSLKAFWQCYFLCLKYTQCSASVLYKLWHCMWWTVWHPHKYEAYVLQSPPSGLLHS